VAHGGKKILPSAAIFKPTLSQSDSIVYWIHIFYVGVSTTVLLKFICFGYPGP